MTTPAVVLTIAASDCSGGAGIQADIKAITALGGYAASVVTALTAQNTLGIRGMENVSTPMISAQLEAVLADMHPKAIKIGIVNTVESVRMIAEKLPSGTPVVYDPVAGSTSGFLFMSQEMREEVCRHLLPSCSLITPNLHEASLLLGRPISNVSEMHEAAHELCDTYHCGVLIKGGHLGGDEMTDILLLPDLSEKMFSSRRVISGNLHGTGCTMSSAIATFLARGFDMEKAVERAKKYVTEAIAGATHWTIGGGNGPLCHLTDWRER